MLDSIASITVVVHMTGLLLIVPSKQRGDPTYVLMPDQGAHAARIGFEYPNRPDLCVQPYQGGICYVDMEVWSLDPIGAGGTPETPRISDLPDGIINVTHGSGNQHRVDIPAHEDQVISTFLSGRPVDPPCSLGSWYYDPVGLGNQRIVPVANVVNWQLQLPGPSLQLLFRRRANPLETRMVTLDPSSGTIEMLLAHVPTNELDRLPPGIPNRPITPFLGTEATHFDAFYDPLGVPQGNRRRLPRFFRATRSDACPVRIRTFRARFQPPFFTVDTHSCMVAAAEIS